jgi:cation diffusion facilitator CzcD-associated flavoprotein CzcO
MVETNGSSPAGPSVAIVGAGFGGIGLGIRLKAAGFGDFTILERAPGVGGVWRDNTYPGLTCDVPSHLYSFSFEPKHDWSRRFPKRAEILAYLEGCVERYGLRDHLRLDTEVASADFDEAAGRWRIRTAGGEELEADVLVTATGQLSNPQLPDIPGIEDFAGPAFHSARWDHDAELENKRVAVVGVGASAIQFVPEIAREVERLTIFQRSPNWVIPKPDRPYRPRQRALFRRFPWLQSASRAWVWARFELFTLAFTRVRALGALYQRGCERRLRREVPDPELQEKLLPDFPLGCKRVLISNEWYPTLQQPHVDLVTEPISQIRPGGVVTIDGTEHPADVLIFGTGFAAHDFLAPMAIRGREGRDLNEAWREGAEAYLGLTVTGFPNMFMLYGPNTNLGAGSIVYMLESQIDYVVEAVRALRRERAAWMEVRPDVQSRFNDDIQRRLAESVWTAGCTSWYRTESGKVTNNWPGFTYEYRRLTREPDLADFELAAGR